MEMNPVDSTILNSVLENQNIEAQYAVKLIKMAQQSDAVVATLLEDTVEISQEAMDKFLSERAQGQPSL